MTPLGGDLGSLLVDFLALLPAFVLHEFSHALVATALGDPTPRRSGRLTLNPLAHLDLVGLLMLYVFRFGWARPVPINPYHFRNRRSGMLLVALAGPLANLVMALVGLVVRYRLGYAGALGLAGTFWSSFTWINLSLAAFNLIPVPPLDGSRILSSLLPGSQAYAFSRLEQYGWVLLLLLLVTGAIGAVLRPLVVLLAGILQPLALFLARLLPA